MGHADQKWFLKSKTVWGAIIMLASSPLLTFVGIEPVTPAEGQSWMAAWENVAHAGSELVGLLMAWYGRQKASGTLTWLP